MIVRRPEASPTDRRVHRTRQPAWSTGGLILAIALTGPFWSVAHGAGLTASVGSEPAVEGLAQQGGSTARDRSDFTMLRDEGFPLNVDPEVVAADEAELDDGDMVMGVVINGEARAYPVNYMNGPTNEVVNDVLGGAAIAPSW